MRDSYTFYLDQLEGEYKEIFHVIDIYVGTQRWDEDTQEEKMSELLDIFISAQKSNRPVEKIVGADVEQFCKNFCDGYDIRSRILKIADYFHGISVWLMIICGIDFLAFFMDLSDGKSMNFWTYTGELNMTGYIISLLMIILVGVLVDLLLRRLIFRGGKAARRICNLISICVSIIIFVATYMLLGIDSRIIKNCPLWILFVFSGAYYVIYHRMNRERLKKRKSEKVKFWKLVQQESLKSLPEEMEKKYIKKKARWERKGKPELSREAFLDLEEKDCTSTMKTKWFYYLAPVVFTVMEIINIYFTEGFRNAADIFCNVGILFLVMWLVMTGLWKIVKKGVEERLKWIEEERGK